MIFGVATKTAARPAGAPSIENQGDAREWLRWAQTTLQRAQAHAAAMPRGEARHQLQQRLRAARALVRAGWSAVQQEFDAWQDTTLSRQTERQIQAVVVAVRKAAL